MKHSVGLEFVSKLIVVFHALITGPVPLALFLSKIALASESSPTVNTSSHSWTLMYQNNLNSSDDTNHIGALLTDPVSSQVGVNACKSVNEAPLSWDSIVAHSNDFVALFNYLCYTKHFECPQTLWIENGAVVLNNNATSIERGSPAQSSGGQSLPQLCTQSDAGNAAFNSGPTGTNQIAVTSANNSNTYIGYRNQKSFRFLGVRFASKPGRFVYSHVSDATGKTYNNTVVAPKCVQGGDSEMSEDCLFLNIQTPYLPKADLTTKNLKPVLFYIHGGALIGGSSDDWTTDGSNIAAREDVVVINTSYRLGTYGFLSVPGTAHMGNYALSDVINALNWVHANIAYFGGDASKISIVGQSAGAALVRALLGSPKATGLFHNAIAMSNLGGAVDLGESGDWGTTNSFYYTIQESYDSAGSTIMTDAGCDGPNDASKVNCLVSFDGVGKLAKQARWIVQDGVYVTGPYLEAGNPGSVANVPFLSGHMQNDGASFVNNQACSSEVDCLSTDLGIGKDAAQSIVDSRLFPYTDTGNSTRDGFNVSQRVRTDDTFLCVDQATAYAAAKTKSMGPAFYYQNNRGLGGYNPAGVPDGSVSNSAGTPYYRLHSADTQFVFGNVVDIHGSDDLKAMRVLTSYWASFVRSGNPNPDLELLRQRGYMDTYRAVTEAGTWQPISGDDGPMMLLDAQPALQHSFIDIPQCKWLNYSLDYFVVHPKGLE